MKSHLYHRRPFNKTTGNRNILVIFFLLTIFTIILGLTIMFSYVFEKRAGGTPSLKLRVIQMSVLVFIYGLLMFYFSLKRRYMKQSYEKFAYLKGRILSLDHIENQIYFMNCLVEDSEVIIPFSAKDIDSLEDWVNRDFYCLKEDKPNLMNNTRYLVLEIRSSK